jgi:DNA modification methylase
MKRRPRTALRILKGDNRETLHQVRAETVQTCVTSPPYWAVRDYDTTPLVFPAMEYRPAIGLPTYHVPAWAGQLGLEPDPWHYIGHLVATFREVRRVLRPDGTLWVNLGDTY